MTSGKNKPKIDGLLMLTLLANFRVSGKNSAQMSGKFLPPNVGSSVIDNTLIN